MFWRSVNGPMGFWPIRASALTGDWSATGTMPGPNWTVEALADLTGDGHSDILFRDEVAGTVRVWPLIGTQRGGEHIDIGSVPEKWNIVAVADFSGDGQNDILWHYAPLGIVGAWVMNRTTVVAWYQISQIGDFWEPVAAADFTGDGNPDIVWSHPLTGVRGIWPMDRLSYTGGWISLGLAPSQWHIAGTGEFTGDANLDLMWQNSLTGDRGIGEIQNNSSVAYHSIGIVPLSWSMSGVLPSQEPVIRPAKIHVSASVASFSALLGAGNPAAQTALVWTIHGPALNWTATSTVPWLTVTGSGTHGSPLILTPNFTGLAAGLYTGRVNVSAAGATHLPASVEVTLNVVAPK
jgi:hypothetical protein